MPECIETPVVCPSSKMLFQSTRVRWKCKCRVELAVTRAGQGWDLHSRRTSCPTDFPESVTAFCPKADALLWLQPLRYAEEMVKYAHTMCASGSKSRARATGGYLLNNGLCSVYFPAEMELWLCFCDGNSSEHVYQGSRAHMIQNI